MKPSAPQDPRRKSSNQVYAKIFIRVDVLHRLQGRAVPSEDTARTPTRWGTRLGPPNPKVVLRRAETLGASLGTEVVFEESENYV